MAQGNAQHASDPDGVFARRVATALAIAALFVAGALVVWHAGQIFLLAFVSVLVAIFLNAPARFIHSRTGMPYTLSLVLGVLVLLGVFVAGAFVAGPSVSTQANQLIEEFPSSLEQVRQTVSGWPGGQWLLGRLSGAGQSADGGGGLGLLSQATGAAAGIFDAVTKLVFVLALGMFLAIAPAMYRDGVVSLFPRARRPRAREALTETGAALQGWMLGQLVSVAAVGILTGIGLWIIGVPLALVLGVIAGLSQLVPIIGVFFGFIPAALLGLSLGTTTLLWVIVLFIVVQQLDGNVIAPLVQRRAIDLPPALTIAAVFVGGALFGPLGFLVGTPMVAAMMVLVKMLYLRDAQGEDVDLPSDR